MPRDCQKVRDALAGWIGVLPQLGQLWVVAPIGVM